MLSPMLFFLEQLVMNETSPIYLRVLLLVDARSELGASVQ